MSLKSLSTKIIIGAIVAALIITAGWGYWASSSVSIAAYWLGGATIEQAGQWGDSFGALNALFTALGFSAVLATLLVQAHALQLQQHDLHRQRFESSFFQLLGLLREVRAELRYHYSDDFVSKNISTDDERAIKHGKAAILYAVREIRYWVDTARAGGKPVDREALVRLYREKVVVRHESDFAPYFRLIQTVLDRVRGDPVLTPEEKATYSNLLRSQLESHEIFLLGVNALTPGAKHLHALVERFQMLKDLPEGLRRETLHRMYGPQALAAEAREAQQGQAPPPAGPAPANPKAD